MVVVVVSLVRREACAVAFASPIVHFVAAGLCAVNIDKGGVIRDGSHSRYHWWSLEKQQRCGECGVSAPGGDSGV